MVFIKEITSFDNAGNILLMICGNDILKKVCVFVIPNVNAAYPRLTVDSNNHNNQSSSYWLRSGSFLKLKNLEIGYSFKKCRLYLSGENILTFSPFKEWDPEMGANGAVTYPNQRTFNIGFQMSFN